MPETMFMGTLYGRGGPGTSTNTTVASMRKVPVPSTDMDAGSEGYSELIDLEFGGADVVASAESHRVYDMVWNTRPANGAEGLDIIKRYSQRNYGPGLIYFADPFNYTTNLLPPNWASPGLIEQGWRGIYGTTPTFTAGLGTAANDMPLRAVTYPITLGVGVVPTDPRHFAVIPIHPEYTLRLWFSYLRGAGSTGVIRVRPINLDGSYGAVVDLSDSASVPWSYSTNFSGSTFKAVEIYITRNAINASSSITISAGIAQMYRTGVTPVLSNQWYAGQGNNGCKFVSPAIPETYIMADPGNNRILKGLAATLVEVGNSVRYPLR